MSTGLLGTLGGMGTEQAALLAAQNAGLGVGADIATLNAAATAGGGWATPWAVAGKVAKGANIANKAMGVMQAGQQQQRAAPPPLDTVGLRYYTIRLPDAAERQRVAARLTEQQIDFAARADGLFLHDPAGNGILIQ